MMDSTAPEEFYRSGTYCDPDIGLYLSWTCREAAFNDCQPISNEDQDALLFLTGEVSPDPTEIAALRKKGHQLRGDAGNYLIHLYEEQGIGFLRTLNGWFSGLLVDQKERRCYLFNDRYGMERIFIHQAPDEFYFASEAKALLAVLPETRDFDPVGLAQFFTCGCTLGVRSLFNNITVLPSGSVWTLARGDVEKRAVYFDRAEWKEQDQLGSREFLESFLEIFPKAVARSASGRQKIGLSLTGGIDSRMVVACLDTSTRHFPFYTFGSMYRDTFDVRVAREVAKDCGQTHDVLVLGKEFLADLPRYLEKAVFRSDGYLGLSGAAELYVNRLARDIAPVRLTGNYGGELLRGTRTFRFSLPRGEFFSPDFLPFLVEAQRTFEELSNGDRTSFSLFFQAPSQGYGRLAIERSQLTLRTPFMDNDLVRLVYRAPLSLLSGSDLCSSVISRYRPSLLIIPTDQGLLGARFRALRRWHRQTLFKAEYWTSHGLPQWLAPLYRFGAGPALEGIFVGRHKFQHFRHWLEKDAASYVRETLSQRGTARLSSFVCARRVEQMVTDHLAARRNYTDEIDKLLTTVVSQALFPSRN